MTSTVAVRSATGVPRASVLGLLARASSPAERIAGGWLAPTGDPALAQIRLDRWQQRIADGRAERVLEVLSEHGLTLDEWRASLGDVTVKPGEPLPIWTQDALTLLDLVGTEPGPHRVPRLREVAGEGLPEWVDPDQPWRFYPGFRDWMAAAAREVDAWTKSAPMSGTARRDLVVDLARRQLVVSGPLLMQVAAARPDSDALFATDARGDWERIWSTHPVVARLLATVWRQWRETTAELCDRIATDLPTVCPAGEVCRIDLSAGDQHCGGRGVARLRLSDGGSVFCKPRSDGLHRVLGTVLARVEAAGTPLGLRLPEVIERAGYAWVREVSPGDCADDAAVDAYFRRAGALLRVVQAMGSTDLHHENFVPATDLPVLVDLETVVAPGPLRTAEPEDAVAGRLSDMPGPTSMVSSVVSGPPGRITADIGALAGPTEALTPYAVRMLVLGNDGPELRSARAPLVNGSALPTRSGRPIALRGHEQALIEGYSDAQRRLELTTGSDFGSDQLDNLGPAPSVRFVARPTRTYARLLVQSTAPDALVDGVEREFVLELLYRATGTAPRGLIACEVEAMRVMDVPLFTVPFARADLVSDRGLVMPDVLTRAPDVRTRNRLRVVANRQDQVDDLRATLFAMDPEGVAAGPFSPDRSDRPIDRQEPINLLLDRAVEGRSGTLGWIGLEHDPNRNRWTYGLIGPGLTGQAGIGLALATIAARAAEPVAGCAQAARSALLGSVQRIGRGDRGPADAFSGPAGILYATAVAARLLNDAVLLDASRSLIEPSLRAARRAQPSFVIDGVAGAILALLQLPDDTAADALTELDALINSADNIASDEVDTPDSWSNSLPSRAVGRALARRRLASVRAVDDLPELPAAATPGDEIAWVTQGLPPGTDLQPVGSALRALLDRGALAQAGLASGGEGWATPIRTRVVHLLVDRRARTGRWAAPLMAPDSTFLSPVHGMAALAVLCADLGADLPNARALT